MERRAQRLPRLVILAAVLLFLLIFGRSICTLILDYHWWQEIGQVSTWARMMEYRYGPPLIAWVLIWGLLWIAHARGLKYAGIEHATFPGYSRIVAAAAGLVALLIATSTVDGWLVARYVGGREAASSWQDPAFGKPLSFYLFDLPFYSGTIGFLLTCTFTAAAVFYLTARFWQLRRRYPALLQAGTLEWEDFRSLGKLESGILNFAVAVFLLGLAAKFWLGRYQMVYSDHGNLLVGIDYVEQHIGLPMQTAKAAAALLAAALVLFGLRKWAIACALVLVVSIGLPPLVSGVYVRPNELALEKPFLQRHIEATRHAYALDRKVQEVQFNARREAPIDVNANRAMLDNVRLWDWRAFHDTVSQTQPLRPYAYADTDVDRYRLDGQLRQVLLTPRELDLNQLGEAQRRWINSNLTFTHGYGFVMAEANRISPSGLPELLVKDAPIQVLTPSLKVTRPEIYYGESSHEPVFVRTQQPEFNYPSGSNDIAIMYNGRGGFPIGSSALRLAATIAEGDWNISLSDAITSESRMMIRRKIPERLQALAEFIRWDADPYLVITDAGRLVWIVDGYTTTDLHPYSREVANGRGETYNYIRNSIKAAVDAYDGTVHMYVFDPEDPLIQAYRNLFPSLFTDAAEMPADLRAHTRYPEGLFSVQAEIFRTYHMRDPESYYNRADLWDLATYTSGQGARPEPLPPSYIVAAMPGSRTPEFLLTLPFTPRNKQNLIGLMVARCDGEHLGELVFLELPKQEIIPGPLQIEALINQDQVISKDLSLWNQQGSQVLRSQMLTLPIDNTFLFVAPIYIQASEARMPQLRKVVLAVGSTVVYEDSYEQALARLAAEFKSPAAEQGVPVSSAAGALPRAPAAPAGGPDPRIAEIRSHLERYRALASQGRWAEAGKELEAVESLVRK
jgi:uncharacterized membrane protein (UPF0182 family)